MCLFLLNSKKRVGGGGGGGGGARCARGGGIHCVNPHIGKEKVMSSVEVW